MSILTRTTIYRFCYIYRTTRTSPSRFQFNFSSSYSSNVADDYPTGDFVFKPLTGFNKFLVRLKTMLALPSERVQHGSVLKINLEGDISEQFTTKVLSLPEICDNFLKAAYDPRISAIYLCIDQLSCGWAKLDEIRRQILNFRKSGKMVVSYLPFIRPKEYYLACVCDEIFAPPTTGNEVLTADINNCGLLVGVMKHNLGYHSFRRGLFDNPYDDLYNYEYLYDSREAETAFVDSIYSNWLDKVSYARGKKREEVVNFINEGVYEVDKLKKEGFISSLVHDDDDEVITLLKERLGVKSLPMISFRKYSKVRKWTVGISEAKERIAIIRASGSMDSGIIIGNFIEKIGMVKASKKFKAVIIRIDCTGGDLSASQLLWDEIRSVAAKKPVVASMSDVAVGAGYYMAMGAEVIVAENLTLTSSMGVSQNLTFENHHFQMIDSEVMRRGLCATELRSLSPYEAELDKVYKIKEVLHGKIWIGKDAATHGLVDAIGGISCAVAIAKLKANIPQNKQVTLVELSRPSPSLLMLLRGWRSSTTRGLGTF